MPPAVAISGETGSKAVASTPPVVGGNWYSEPTGKRDGSDHSRTVPSSAPLARNAPFGSKATWSTMP